MLWAVIGAGGAVYAFVMTTQTYYADSFLFPQWNGEPGLIVAVGGAAEVSWVVLSVPVLVAGIVRLGGWRPANWLHAAAWAGAWVAGVALICLTMVWANAWENRNGPAVSWGELPLCAASLALGAIMTWILAKPAQPQR